MITTNGPPHMVWDGLFRSVCTDNAEVGSTASLGNGQDRNEKHGVGPGD